MFDILLSTQVLISVLLSLLILIQNKDGGLVAAFGSSGEGFQATRRGAEKVIDWATVILAILFLANAFAFVLI